MFKKHGCEVHQHNDYGNPPSWCRYSISEPSNIRLKIFLLRCIKANIPLGKGTQNGQYHEPDHRIDKNLRMTYTFNNLFHQLLVSRLMDEQKVLKSFSKSIIPSLLAVNLIYNVLLFIENIAANIAASLLESLIN